MVSEKITLSFRHAGHSTINHYTKLHFLMRISKRNNWHPDHKQNQTINNGESWQCQQRSVAASDLCSAGIMTTLATDLSSVTSVCIMSTAATNLCSVTSIGIVSIAVTALSQVSLSCQQQLQISALSQVPVSCQQQLQISALSQVLVC